MTSFLPPIKGLLESTLIKLKELETTQSTTATGGQFLVKTEVSMVDGKMVGLLMGDLG